MAEKQEKGFSPEYRKILADAYDEADAVVAPSVAHAARRWVDDETLDDMVRRGVAINIGCLEREES